MMPGSPLTGLGEVGGALGRLPRGVAPSRRHSGYEWETHHTRGEEMKMSSGNKYTRFNKENPETIDEIRPRKKLIDPIEHPTKPRGIKKLRKEDNSSDFLDSFDYCRRRPASPPHQQKFNRNAVSKSVQDLLRHEDTGRREEFSNYRSLGPFPVNASVPYRNQKRLCDRPVSQEAHIGRRMQVEGELPQRRSKSALGYVFPTGTRPNQVGDLVNPPRRTALMSSGLREMSYTPPPSFVREEVQQSWKPRFQAAHAIKYSEPPLLHCQASQQQAQGRRPTGSSTYSPSRPPRRPKQQNNVISDFGQLSRS